MENATTPQVSLPSVPENGPTVALFSSQTSTALDNNNTNLPPSNAPVAAPPIAPIPALQAPVMQDTPPCHVPVQSVQQNGTIIQAATSNTDASLGSNNNNTLPNIQAAAAFLSAPSPPLQVPANNQNNSVSSQHMKENPPTPFQYHYTETDAANIRRIEQEFATMFPKGEVFPSVAALRDKVKEHANKNGFCVVTEGSRILCTRCATPNGYKKRKDKQAALNQIPVDKQRNRQSTRVGCPFKISYSLYTYKKDKNAGNAADTADSTVKAKADQRVKITASCCYTHDNGCKPSRTQLAVEKRKSGAFTAAIHESQIKTILGVMATGQPIPTRMFREIVHNIGPVCSRSNESKKN
mmetsp:Transcript_5757/g.10379  ORF Transcript_5757/g.10379 Transcript_5757/m.10379 type:complete len:353 (-) Transcript_5757:261-1319(-)